jgi:uncharacterized membrane protein
MQFIYLVLLGLLASIAGVWISWRIWRSTPAKATVGTGKGLMCPREMPCDEVVQSRYGSTLGVSNATIGIAYFVWTSVGFAILLNWHLHALARTMSIVGSASILFSLYLIAVQAFVLKKWCAWCLGSAAANAIIWIVLLLLVW